jgi:hypothetical protein
MKRAKGTTLVEIMAVTKWQAHAVRGFVSIISPNGDSRCLDTNQQDDREFAALVRLG